MFTIFSHPPTNALFRAPGLSTATDRFEICSRPKFWSKFRSLADWKIVSARCVSGSASTATDRAEICSGPKFWSEFRSLGDWKII